MGQGHMGRRQTPKGTDRERSRVLAPRGARLSPGPCALCLDCGDDSDLGRQLATGSGPDARGDPDVRSDSRPRDVRGRPGPRRLCCDGGVPQHGQPRQLQPRLRAKRGHHRRDRYPGRLQRWLGRSFAIITWGRPGASGPQATAPAEPVPEGAFTLSGVVNSVRRWRYGGPVDRGRGQHRVRAVVAVDVQRLGGLYPHSIAAGSVPPVDVAGQPACFEVNGALLTVLAVATATATDTPVPGAAWQTSPKPGPASGTGASVDGPTVLPAEWGCNLRAWCPEGEPATASPATCTTPRYRVVRRSPPVGREGPRPSRTPTH